METRGDIMIQPSSIEILVVVLTIAAIAVPICNAILHRSARCGIISSRSALCGISVVALGLLASIIAPMAVLLILVAAAMLIPMEKKMMMGLLIIGCLAIAMGSALDLHGIPPSQIALMKLYGPP
ncbi:MAG: DUF1646 family protein [Methanotrichaceae archaeon]|nr:DUF1646 family protein [Methanotrichaceae archaeon]